MIERRPGGYVLTIDQLSVDLHRFRKLIDDARLAADDAGAVALFDQALRWWRGTPFAGLDTPWLASVRAALEVERLAAQLDRTDAALRCGQHTHLVAELSTRAAQQPLDERVAGQLMLALAGAGRPADALAAYRHTRRALCDELGLEPGPELRRLHENILAGDQQPASPTPGDRVSPAVVPHQLPAAARHFAGRHAELDMLTGLLGSTGAADETVVISAVDGMAGVGKTALTVHAAHQLADRFPDGVLFSDLRGFSPEVDPMPPEQALDQLLRGLGVPGSRIPPDLDARAGLYRSVLTGRRMLIVLDNAADEAQLQPLLPATVGCRVIVTSRRRLVGLDDAVHITLPVLDPVEAARLFRDLAGECAATADGPVVDRIVTLCGQLPLAIRIAATRLRSAPATTPAVLCAELADALNTGRGLAWLTDGHRAILAALAVSHRHLTAGQQHTFRLTGLHPGPAIEPYAMAALADTTVEDARRLLDELYAASLLNQPSHRRYTLHDLVAAYATSLACDLPEADRRAALDRLCAHYAATSSLAMNLTHPWDAAQRPHPPATHTPVPTLEDQEQAQRWLDGEIDNLLATAHHAAGHRADHTVHQSATLHRHLRTRGQYHQAALLHRRALAIARRTGDHTAEQHALIGLGDVHHVQGRYGPAEASYEKALASARRTGDCHAEQAALGGLGHVHLLQGAYGRATACWERALTSARQTGNRHAEQDALRGFGYVYRVQGRYGPALDCLEQALTSARRTGPCHAEQLALIGLGHVHLLRGAHAPAADCFEQALAGAGRTGNQGAEQDSLIGLGYLHLQRGAYGLAACRFHQALTGTRATGYRNGQFEAHQGLGRVHHATNHHREALDHHNTALQLAVDLTQPADQARAHDGLANTYRAMNDPDRARHHWRTALDVLTAIGTDHTEESDVTTTTIRTHLHDLTHRPAWGASSK